jgi:hypothetical protein
MGEECSTYEREKECLRSCVRGGHFEDLGVRWMILKINLKTNRAGWYALVLI